MAVYRETLYKDRVIWRTRLKQNEGLYSRTSKPAIKTESESEIIEGVEVTVIKQKVITDNKVEETTEVSFYGNRVGGNELHFTLPVPSVRDLYDENINNLVAFPARRRNVTKRLRYYTNKKLNSRLLFS